MAHDRRPRSLGLLGLLLGASAITGVGILAQTPAPAPDVTFSTDVSNTSAILCLVPESAHTTQTQICCTTWLVRWWLT